MLIRSVKLVDSVRTGSGFLSHLKGGKENLAHLGEVQELAIRKISNNKNNTLKHNIIRIKVVYIKTCVNSCKFV